MISQRRRRALGSIGTMAMVVTSTTGCSVFGGSDDFSAWCTSRLDVQRATLMAAYEGTPVDEARADYAPIIAAVVDADAPPEATAAVATLRAAPATVESLQNFVGDSLFTFIDVCGEAVPIEEWCETRAEMLADPQSRWLTDPDATPDERPTGGNAEVAVERIVATSPQVPEGEHETFQRFLLGDPSGYFIEGAPPRDDVPVLGPDEEFAEAMDAYVAADKRIREIFDSCNIPSELL